MSKIRNDFNHIMAWNNQWLWCILAFHAGYLNAGGFISSHRFVSHMTGFGTAVGISVSEHDYWIALEMLLAPISFLVGSALAGYLVDRKIIQDRQPKVTKGVLIIILMNTIIFLGGISGYFGEFAEPLLLQRDFALLFMLSFVCGLQNGLFVSLTSGQIRTTHITGLVTDVGLSLARSIVIKNHDLKKTEKKRNGLRIRKVLSFSVGSLISAVIFNRLGYWGFLGSLFISFIILGLVEAINRYTPPASVGVDPGQVGEQKRV